MLTLSELAKEKIYKYLYNLSNNARQIDNNKYAYRTSDLILALYCFNREDKKSNYYRLLESIGNNNIVMYSTVYNIFLAGMQRGYRAF